MRADAHELEHIIIRLPVDQHQIGLDVAVPVILPFPSQGVVREPGRQGLVIHQQLKHRHQDGFNAPVFWRGLDPLEVALERAGVLNGPH